MSYHLLPLRHTAPPDMVTGGAGKLPVHGRDEIFLGTLEHAQVGFCQRQKGGGHCLGNWTGGYYSVVPLFPPNKHMSALLSDRHTSPPALPPHSHVLDSPGCPGPASCPLVGPGWRHQGQRLRIQLRPLFTLFIGGGILAPYKSRVFLTHRELTEWHSLTHLPLQQS